MLNEMVTLHIDDTSVRLLVISGGRIKKWADLKLEPGLIKDGVVLQEAEVAAKIKNLFIGQHINTRKVTLGYSGLHALTRPATLPQLPKQMVGEAVAREARRVLPLPLDQLYLAWRTIPCPKGRIQVFMAATPRKTADSLISTLDQAGLEPSRMAIKPLSLTQASPEKTAILVDLQPSEFDLVIISAGVPQPIRTIALPDEELTWNKKIEMIAGDLSQTIKFFDTNNPEKPLNADVPIYVSGELLNKTEMHTVLSDIVGHPIKTLSPHLKGIEQIDLSRYLFNVTMANSPTSIDKELVCPAGALNVLPAPYQPKPISLAKVIGIPAGVAVAALIIPMVIMIQNTSANINTLQDQTDKTNEMIRQKTAQKVELSKTVADLSKQATAAKLAYDNLNLALNKMQTQQEHVNGDLAISLGVLPSDIIITGITYSGDTLAVSGEAPNQEDIYQYAQTILQYGRQMDLSQRFRQTTVSIMKAKDSKTDTLPAQTQGDQDQDNQTVPTPSPTLALPATPAPDKIEFTLTFKR
jgi:type IV pilus assembly protein PilM